MNHNLSLKMMTGPWLLQALVIIIQPFPRYHFIIPLALCKGIQPTWEDPAQRVSITENTSMVLWCGFYNITFVIYMVICDNEVTVAFTVIYSDSLFYDEICMYEKSNVLCLICGFQILECSSFSSWYVQSVSVCFPQGVWWTTFCHLLGFLLRFVPEYVQ